MQRTNSPATQVTPSAPASPIARATRRRRWAAGGAALASLAFAVGVSGGSAAAHVAPITASCDGVQVILDAYDPAGVNLLEVWIDGTAQASTTFGTGASAMFPFSDPFRGHTYRVRVSAWDDPTGSAGWSFETSGSVDVCAAQSTAPPTSATSTPSTEPASTEPASTATTAPPTPSTPTTPVSSEPVVSAAVTSAPSTPGPATSVVVAQAGATGATPAPTLPAGSGTLPVTGSNLLVVGSLAILLVGAFLVLAARRPA